MKTGFILWIAVLINGQVYERVSHPFPTKAACETARKHYKPMVVDSRCYPGTVIAKPEKTGSN